MIKTDKLLPLINKIKQDKKKLNGPTPGLPAKTQAKAMSKPIITNQDGQDLFPGLPTMIQGKGAGTSITMRNTNPQIALTPYGAAFMQPNMNYNFAGNSVLELPVAQMGGDPQQDQLMQMIQIYAQMKQMDPNELLKKIQALPQDQQQQALQSISQEVQQVMAQQQEAQAGQEGQEQMPEGEMMSQGGEPCIDCFDNYNPSPQAQNLEWFYNKAKQELPKHQGKKSQVGKPKLGDFQVGLGKFDENQFRKNVINTQPAATGSGTSVPYNMEEDLKMQQLAAQKMAQYHNNDRAFDSTYFASTIPITMNQMVNGIDISYQKGRKNQRFKNQHGYSTEYPGNYFWTDEDILSRHSTPYSDEYYNNYNKEGDYTAELNSDGTFKGSTYRSFKNPSDSYNYNDYSQGTTPRNPYIIPTTFLHYRDQRNPQEIRQGQQAAYNAWQKGDKLTKSYLTDDQINQLAQRMASGQNFSDISYEEMLSVPDLKKVQEAAAKLGKKAKGGRALPKHQWATSQTGTTQPGNPTMNPYLLQKIQESMQAQNAKPTRTTQDILAEARRMPTMASDATSVAAVQQKKQELNKDIKEHGSFENAQKAKAIKKAQQDQQQSQVYETIDINPNEYALAAMSSPYTGNDPRIIRDAANQTNRQIAPIAAGAAAATGSVLAPIVYNEAIAPTAETAYNTGINFVRDRIIPSAANAYKSSVRPVLDVAGKILHKTPLKGIPGIGPHLNLGNAIGVKMLYDFNQNIPEWGEKWNKAVETGSAEDIKALAKLTAEQGLNISPIFEIPEIIGLGHEAKKVIDGLKVSKYIPSLSKIANTAEEIKGAKFAIEQTLHHLVGDHSNEGHQAEYSPRYTQPSNQLFIPESTGIYPNYLNIPQSVATQYYGNKKVGGEAFPQANYYPTDWASYSGNQYMEGGEAFPQAQTYLPYSRLRRFAQGGPDKPVKGKMDPSSSELSDEEMLQYEAEQAAQQAQEAAMNKMLGPFYTPGSSLDTYGTNPSVANQSGQDIYYTPSYFGATDRYSQTTRPFTLQDAQQIALANNTSAFRPAAAPVAVVPQPGTATSPVTSPSTSQPVTKVDDSKWFSNSDARKNYFELGINPKANVKMRPDENTFQNQSLAVPINVGFGNNRWGVNVTGGLNFDKSIANPATVISSDATSPSTSPVRMTTTPITFGATRKGTNSTLGVTGGYSPDSGDFNVGANYTLKFGKKPEQRDGGSFETRPNFMFAEGGDTDDQFGGQLDMDSIYRIMKAGGFAKDPKKKKGKELSPADFMAYVRSQSSKKKVGGEMLPKHDVVGQTGTPTVGTFKDPTGNADWTYSYNNGAWTAYNKGKSYDINKNPKYKTSIDKLNAAYPGGKDPNAVTNNTSNPANTNTNTGTTTTNQGTTANQGAPAGNTTTSANPSGAISANPLDYLNMVNSQTGNKGIVGALTSVANAANLVGYLGTGWGSGEKKEKEKKPQTPNIPIQQQNENKQAKANLQQKVNEYKNDYVYPQSTPEVDPLAGGDFMSSMDSQYPMQQNYTSGYDAYRMEEDGKNPTAMQPKQASTLYTTQDNSTVKPSPKVPLTGPYMRPQDRPSPYEQWKEDMNDPNNLNYQFNERGEGVSGVKDPMNINAYPFDFYQPINDNPYQRSYRRGGDIYLPKHATDPIVVSGMQGQGQSMNLSQNNNLSQPASNPYNLYSTQTPAAVQNSAGYQAVQTANQNATRIADQNVTAQGTDTTGGAPSASSTQKSAAPKFRPGVMDFGEVGSNGKHLTFDVAGASRAVGGLGQIKDYLAGINQQKQADKLAAKLNTSEFMGMAQMGGMQDMGDYLVNPTQGPSFRPNAYTQAQKQSEVRMEQPLLYGRMGGTLDMYEDGEEYDLTQEEIDQILAAGGTVEYI